MKKTVVLAFVIFLALAAYITSFIGCGSSSSTTTTTNSETTEAFPSGLALASPTASGASNLSLSQGFVLKAATLESTGTFVDKKEALDTVVAAATDEACQVTLPSTITQANPDCYGPTLDYCDHKDFDGVNDAGCDNRDSQNDIDDTDGDDQLPNGDLGLWTATEGDEACAAAKINDLVTSSSVQVDKALLMSASMICLLSRSGTALPSTDGDSVDMTSTLNTAIQENNPNITVTSASIENLADVTASDSTTHDAFKYTIVTTDSSSTPTVTVSTYLKHVPLDDTNATYVGRLWTETSHGAAGSERDRDALSLSYEKEASSLLIKMSTATWQLSNDGEKLFNDNGSLNITGGLDSDIAQTIINIDPSTGLGNFSYAWSAGSDSHARIFNGFTNATGACGFFGYGDNWDVPTDTDPDAVIDGMICNWAGTGNNHGLPDADHGLGKAQKQCMTIDANGAFALDTTRNKISYAPTVSCDGDGTMQVRIGVSPTSTGTAGDYADAVTTNDLVPDLSADADFADYSAPTAPDLPTGF